MIIDLRSDTVTKPTAAMRDAMARAKVGDDVYAEDPTVRTLEERVAALLGKEAALFVPSGTMANQIALWLNARPGEEVVVGVGAHCMIYETGAASALSGISFSVVGPPRGHRNSGLFTMADAEAALTPRNHLAAPGSAIIAVENTHNRGGGRIFPEADIVALGELAQQKGIVLHMDGARLWNAHVVTGIALERLARPADTVCVCMSKGLGAPVGSLIATTAPDIARARRRRKMLGGGMRQAGIIAAAALHALDHHVARLAVDHGNARHFAERLAGVPGIDLDLSTVETNIVVWRLTADVPFDAAQLVERAKARGLLLGAVEPRGVRAVTHLDVDQSACSTAAEILAEILRAA